jgi:hypothetical protein
VFPVFEVFWIFPRYYVFSDNPDMFLVTKAEGAFTGKFMQNYHCNDKLNRDEIKLSYRIEMSINRRENV